MSRDNFLETTHNFAISKCSDMKDYVSLCLVERNISVLNFKPCREASCSGKTVNVSINMHT
jgi:hypothetical protein